MEISVKSVMTEITETIQLSPPVEKFIVHWGEMGERWGVNRTVAQIHALLYIAPEPLNAEQVSQTLSLARSTVSVGLRELLNWGIIRAVHKLGDRTDYYETIADIWEMFRLIIDRRIQNELDPTVSVLHEVVDQLNESDQDTRSQRKLSELLAVLDTASDIYADLQKTPTEKLVRIIRLRGIVGKVLGLST